MAKIKIGFKFDGVICNWIKAKSSYLWRFHERDVLPEQTSRDTYSELYPVEEYDEMDKILHKSGMTGVPVGYGTINLKNLEKRAEIYIIAPRNEYEASLAKRWLENHKYRSDICSGLFYNHFIYTGSKSEAEICKEKGIQIFLGDSPKSLLEIMKQGVEVYLLRRPYNKYLDSKVLQRQGIEVVKSLKEFVEKF